MVVFEQLQTTLVVRTCVLWSLKVPVAENCSVAPTVSVGFEGDTAIETSAAPPVETVKNDPLLALPATVTSTFPVVAPFGTGTSISVSPQLVGIAGVELNVTVLDPWEAPKLVPVITTEVPTGPEFADRPEIVGAGDVVELIDTLSKVDVTESAG